MYEMKPEYFVGIEFIDQEHKRLFEIADEVYELLTDQFIPDKYDYIVEVVHSLKEYAVSHFDHEEAYMMEIEYKKIMSHKVSHHDFIEKIAEYDSDVIDENQKQALLELMDFLNDWLIDHILKSDTLIGKE